MRWVKTVRRQPAPATFFAEYDDEFLPSKPPDDIHLALAGTELPGTLLQHFIAEGVAVLIVHLLRVVDVENDDRVGR